MLTMPDRASGMATSLQGTLRAKKGSKSISIANQFETMRVIEDEKEKDAD
jgi:hypothetical protein